MICDSLVNLKPHFFRLCKSAASIHECNVFYTLVYMRWISHFTRTSRILCFAILLLSVLSWLNDLIDRVTILTPRPKDIKYLVYHYYTIEHSRDIVDYGWEIRPPDFNGQSLPFMNSSCSTGSNRPFTNWKVVTMKVKDVVDTCLNRISSSSLVCKQKATFSSGKNANPTFTTSKL